MVDDHEVVLRTWKTLLENNPGFKVIGQCLNGKDAITKTGMLQPDILLVDIKMSPMNGFQLTETLLKINPALRIIGLSVNNQPSYAKKIMGLGAKGYLTKTSTLSEINLAIKEVFEGKNYLCEEVLKKMKN
jgi:DNA-binding NarL/FixJ family response regulator